MPGEPGSKLEAQSDARFCNRSPSEQLSSVRGETEMLREMQGMQLLRLVRVACSNVIGSYDGLQHVVSAITNVGDNMAEGKMGAIRLQIEG